MTVLRKFSVLATSCGLFTWNKGYKLLENQFRNHSFANGELSSMRWQILHIFFLLIRESLYMKTQILSSVWLNFVSIWRWSPWFCFSVTTTRPIRTIHVSRHFKEKVDFDMQIIMNADLWELGNRIKNKEIELDLILGHSKGRWTASDNIIPIWYA